MDRSLPDLDAKTWIAAIVHDLRDPMTAIVGMTDLLLDTPLDPDQRRCAETVRDAAHGMTTLINDLLDLSRLQRGDIRIADTAFDLGRAVARSLDLVRPRIGTRPVVLRFQTEPDPLPWVRGDPGRLGQILVNLLVNALNHTAAGEVSVTVTTPNDGGPVEFVVRDTGCGIDPAAVAHLQQPFVRSDGGVGGPGLGLGLAISRHLVVRMGGSLDVAPRPGGGTEVRLSLPLPSVAPPERAPRQAVAARRVAVAGASPALAARLVGQLAAIGAVADVVAAPEALGGRPDVLLLVAENVEPTAAAALAAWRRAVPSPLPALVLVASGLRGDAAAARRAGFDGYLPAFVGTDVLAAALAALGTVEPDGQQRFVTVHGLREEADGPWRLLVVDDNPMNVRLLQLVLERAGHRIETAADGAAAVARARAGGLDAILMDLQMPVLSGLEAAAAIRRFGGEASRVPIVAVTANALEGTAATCTAVGMDGFVTKPIDADRLAAELRRVVAASRAAGSSTP